MSLITVHEVPLLYNLYVDPSEKILKDHKASLVPVENQLEK